MSENILALANPLLCAVFAVAFFALWQRDRSAKWIAIISATYASRTVGFFIFHFTGDPSGALAIASMHVSYSISAITIVWGICERIGQTIHLRTYFLIAALGLLLMIGASFGPDHNVRLYASNGTYGLILALGCQTAAQKIEKDFLDKAIIFLLGMGAFQFFVRPMVAIMFEGAMTVEQYRETPFYAAMVLWLALASLLMAMALLAAALTDQMKAFRTESQRDALTGLKMRGPFEAAAIAMINRAREDNTKVSLIVADIDHFKQVNDIWGHQVGDNAIAGFGELLTSAIRPTDVAGRIGGEEFCLLIWDCPPDATEDLAERIRVRFEQMRIAGMSSDVRLTASFGIASWDTREGYGKLFARADAALYAAKKAGRNRVIGENWQMDAGIDDGTNANTLAEVTDIAVGDGARPEGESRTAPQTKPESTSRAVHA